MPLANQVGTVTARLTGILRHGVMAGSPGETCFFDFFLVSLHLITNLSFDSITDYFFPSFG